MRWSFLEELSLIRPSIKEGGQSAVWAKRSEMRERTPEEMLAYYKQLGVVKISNVEKVIDYIRENSGPFTVSSLQSHFKDMSISPIRAALDYLTSIGELIQHSMAYSRPHTWVKKEDLKEQNIDRYVQSSELFRKPKASRIIAAIKGQKDFFTAVMINNLLSLSSKDKYIIQILERLNSIGDVILVREGSNSVWITKEAAEKKGFVTKEDIERAFRNSDLFLELQSQVERLGTVILSFEEFFTVEGVQKRFKEVSENTTEEASWKVASSTVQRVLKEFTNNGDLIRVREGKNSVWITKEAAQEKGFVTKEDIERAFRNSDLFLELPISGGEVGNSDSKL